MVLRKKKWKRYLRLPAKIVRDATAHGSPSVKLVMDAFSE
jgi:hypothetical protein